MKHFRLIFLLLAIVPAYLLKAGQSVDPCEAFDYSIAARKPHPRIIINDKDLKAVKRQLAGNPQLKAINDAIIDVADDPGTRAEQLAYKLDESGLRLLAVSRQAMLRIVSNAYAYRITGEEKYLRAAEEDIQTVCSFKDWHESHYLDVAEMAAAVAIGYDWLYRQLSPATRKAAVRAIRDYAFATSVDAKKTPGFYNGRSNWNQVCNGGLVCAALATYESDPELARRVIVKSVKSNRPAISHIYAPDGAYPEGPGYWDFGTSYQVLLLSSLESVLGTDFGLYDEDGFSSTGWYKAFANGNAGRTFNFSDSGPSVVASPSLWYFAAKNSAPELVASEIPMLGQYGKSRLAFISIKYASLLGPFTASGMERKVLRADGINPIIVARTGWRENDMYLGIKGGSADANHGHMDAGEFVFDAYGYRWAIDYTHPAYSALEVKLKPFNEDLFDKGQDAMRWQIYGYNNRQHNTLTINDTDHKVNGRAETTEIFEDQDRLGGALDLGEVFCGEVRSAVRSCSIRNGSCLEVIDRIEALDNKSAKVRWNLVTEAQVTVVNDGIVLDNGKVKMKLSARGAGITYRTWPSQPDYYDLPTKAFPAPPEKATLCGFEFEIPAGGAAEVTTTLSMVE